VPQPSARQRPTTVPAVQSPLSASCLLRGNVQGCLRALEVRDLVVRTPAVVNGDFLIDNGPLVRGRYCCVSGSDLLKFSVLVDDFGQLTLSLGAWILIRRSEKCMHC
jgi:hypothetical protein